MPSVKTLRLFEEWLYAQPTPLVATLKEFEKRFKKVKPLTSPQFKEIIDHYLAEDMISVAKCGSLNVYYFYRHLRVQEDKKLFDRLTSGNKLLREEIVVNQEQVERITRQRHDDCDGSRQYMLQKHRDLMTEVSRLEQMVGRFRQEIDRWDSSRIEEMVTRNECNKGKLCIMADNIENLIYYLVKRYDINDEDIRSEFGIPNEFKLYV